MRLCVYAMLYYVSNVSTVNLCSMCRLCVNIVLKSSSLLDIQTLHRVKPRLHGVSSTSYRDGKGSRLPEGTAVRTEEEDLEVAEADN